MALRYQLAAFFWLLSATCNAEVFKCSGPNGSLLRNEPCLSDERTISVDGVPWKKIAAEAERRRILEEEAKQEEANRISAEAYKTRAYEREYQNRPKANGVSAPSQRLEQIYRDLPASTRNYNPNTTEPCHGIVAEIRRLEKLPDFDRSMAIQRQWSNAANLAMRLKCEF